MESIAVAHRRDERPIDFDYYRAKAVRQRRAAKRLAHMQTARLMKVVVRAIISALQKPLMALGREHRAVGLSAKATAAAILIATVGSLPVVAQSPTGHHGGASDHTTVSSGDLKWSAPAAYAKGAQLAVLKGDPTKEGMYVVRLQVPAGFVIAPHTHPNDENVTVISGHFNIGTGDKLDRTRGQSVKAGGYSVSLR
jgi:hypothetical protein